MSDAATDTATARPPHPLIALREQLNTALPEFKAALPPHIPVERFRRIAETAIQMNPELAAVPRRSLFNALMKCASDGLLPDGRQAAIVPFQDRNSRSPYYNQQVAVYMPMIAGLLARFRNSGQFKALTVNVVRQGEQFRHWIDESGEHLLHEPGENDAAPIVKAYAMATTRDGGVALRVMSVAAIDKRRNVSRAKDGPMWKEWYAEAAQKTVLRNLMKILPSSSDDIDRILARDEALEFDTASISSNEPAETPRARIGLASALDQFGGESATAADDAADNVSETAHASDTTGNPPASPSQGSQIEQPTIAVARALGAKHRRDGVERRAVPPEYRDAKHKAEADAWRDGWDHPGGIIEDGQ
jgi:recombination protein RecT